LKATVERTPGSRVVLDIEVPPEEMAPEITQAFRRVAQQVRIPGFRPGKAPAPLVERAVGRPRILQEALNPLVSRAYREAVDQQGLSPVDQPEIEVKEFEDGQPLHFVATVAVKPEVRLGDYASVRVEPRPDPVGDEDVQKALEELRAARATWVPVEEPAADGHLVILRTTGQVADGPRIDQRRVEGVLGEGHLRPEVEAAVRGLVPGSGRDLELRFPEDDPTPTLRGKTAQVHVELLECKRKELPPLDDGLAAEVSEAQSLEELRAELGNRLRQAAEARSEQAAPSPPTSRRRAGPRSRCGRSSARAPSAA
jgi:trigger factor